MIEKNRFKKAILPVIMACLMVFTGCSADTLSSSTSRSASDDAKVVATLSQVDEYDGDPYVIINDNIPDFDEDDMTLEAFESYSELDELGRCGVAYANVCIETMPTEDREAIGQVKPSGWQTVRYDEVIVDKYLYNRCHLIGFQLTGENANEKNLITGTRYMNVTGMLPFEDEVADYVNETNNHVLYRVTPIFEGDNLVASGVQMEAYSVEDNGEGVCFNVYVYNVQPNIVIDYATGDSSLDAETLAEESAESQSEGTFVCNTNTKKYHREDCKNAATITEKNKKVYTGKAQSLIDNGYTPCKTCNP